MAQHITLGQWGEEEAARYLIGQGYAILDRNWRMGHLEVDIVAQRDNRVSFVEVKTRKEPIPDPSKVVNLSKQRHLIAAADVYLRAKHLPFEAQFDVLFVVGDGHTASIEFIPDAFRPRLRTR